MFESLPVQSRSIVLLVPAAGLLIYFMLRPAAYIFSPPSLRTRD
jgi:hypothetical protein